ncbi:hypothetical protein B0T26DRAFT_639661, partial [Lasiosphaeria miniovina]
SFWDRAYDKLRDDDPKLVGEYDVLLAEESKTGFASDDRHPPELVRRAQLDLVIKQGLQRLDDKKIKYAIAGYEFVSRDQVSQAAGLVVWAKDWIGKAVEASPGASIVWAGVSRALPLLTNSKIDDEANRDGFTSVATSMRYYTALETLLLRIETNPGVDSGLMIQATDGIVSLYQQILDFQLRSVLRPYRN